MDDVFTPADAMRADYFYEFHEVGNTDPLAPLAQVTKRVPIPHLATGTFVHLEINGAGRRYTVERVELDLWSGDDSSVYSRSTSHQNEVEVRRRQLNGRL
jgi:hypothetical protein